MTPQTAPHISRFEPECSNNVCVPSVDDMQRGYHLASPNCGWGGGVAGDVDAVMGSIRVAHQD